MGIGSTALIATSGLVTGAAVTGMIAHDINQHDEGHTAWIVPTLGNTQLGMFGGMVGMAARWMDGPPWMKALAPFGFAFAGGSFAGGIVGAELARDDY